MDNPKKERRNEARRPRRALKRAHITFKGRRATIDCTVLNLSDLGACLGKREQGGTMSPADGEVEMEVALNAFVRESNMIEGIMREPSDGELNAARAFLGLVEVSISAVCQLQAAFAPGKPLREKHYQNVCVGGYVAPWGGPDIRLNLENICREANADFDPWLVHVDFELLHPFMDGNGSTGRMLWAWMTQRQGDDPFSLPFLHRFYYQTLAHSRCK
jgi:hypothetical protein